VLLGASRSTPRGGTSPLVLAASRAHGAAEISLCRRGGRTLLTVNTISGDDSAHERIRARVAGLHEKPLPLPDPHPTSRVAIASASSRRASKRRWPHSRTDPLGLAGEAVMAREVTVEAPRATTQRRSTAPSATSSLVFLLLRGTPEAAFVGASPSCSSAATAPPSPPSPWPAQPGAARSFASQQALAEVIVGRPGRRCAW